MSKPWWKAWEKPPVADTTAVQMGIVKRRDGWILVHPEATIRGVKLVTLTSSEIVYHEKQRFEYDKAQGQLERLPKSLRPRRKRVRAEE